MALMSLGRYTAIAEEADHVGEVGGRDAEDVRKDANKKIDDVRKDILGSLTPWIPGDFVVVYGTLLTAWSNIRESFFWLLIISAVAAFTFVILGAFSETGFRTKRQRSKAVKQRLAARVTAGFLVSVFAAVTIPRSGWYDFDWFADNEQSCVLTAGIAVVAVVFVLKGLQKRRVLPI
jgi:hypothetical protein